MENEEFIKRHLTDLADRAWQRGIVLYSEFLNLNELHILHSIPLKDRGVSLRLFGGYDEAERQIAAFLPDAFVFDEELDVPISCICIQPLNEKFSEELSHRDYLGSLMNLGIERNCLGDILMKDHCAFVFCVSKMEEYICRELTRVRHTSVTASAALCDHIPAPQMKDIFSTVSSVRLDSVIASVFSLSRSKTVPYIESGKVFVNSRMVTSNGYTLRPLDVISVRGLGKFRFIEECGQSKKGKSRIKMQLFV